MILQSKSFLRLVLGTAFILLIPLVAMQFSQEVVWTQYDFDFAGTLLFSTGLAYELVTSRASSGRYRLAFGLALGTALFLIWANLAVGLIGSERNPANLLYGGVLAVAVGGALLARFQPRGMVRALLATALAQVLVPVVALLLGMLQLDSAAQITEVLGVTGLFVGLWLGAALLFRRAGARPEQRVA